MTSTRPWRRSVACSTGWRTKARSTASPHSPGRTLTPARTTLAPRCGSRLAQGEGEWTPVAVDIVGDERGVVGFGVDVRWGRSGDWDHVQFAGVVIGADDRTRPGVALESGQLREDSPVEQDRVAHPVLVARGDDRGA